MRSGLKVFGLVLLAAVSMMAVTAAIAQAEGELRVNGKVVEKGVEVPGEATGGEGKLFVPGLELTIVCSSTHVTGTITNEPALMGKAQGTFSGCEVEENSFCTIYPTEEDAEEETNAGIISATALFLYLGRNGSVVYFRSEPLPAQSKYAEWFYGGLFCALPESTEVSGIGVAKSPGGGEESVTHELADLSAAEESAYAEETEMGDIGLFYGEEPAEIIGGSVSGGLTGEYKGQKFSVN